MLSALINGQILTDRELLHGHALIFDRQIKAICPLCSLAAWQVEQVIDVHGQIVSPGLIDTHIHGISGADTMDGTTAALAQISTSLAEHGVTGFLPTTMTESWPRVERAVLAVRRAMQEQHPPGALPLGVHLEGPFLSREFSGAQAIAHLRPPEASLLSPYKDEIRLVTYAPELDADARFARQLLQIGLVPSIGHTAADYETARQAIKAGVSHATHLFNAMAPMHHRHPGALGAILEEGITCELIADDLHVHPSIYRMMLRILGPERIVLVSDSMRATGLGDGLYELGGQAVRVEEGAARVADGRLAGSIITLNQAVFRFQRATGATWPLAFKTVTTNPARFLGMEKQLGSLVPGADASIACFDSELNAHLTIVQGRVVYRRA